MTTFPENAPSSVGTRPEGRIPPVVQVPQDHSTKQAITDEQAVCDRCTMPAVEVDGGRA